MSERSALDRRLTLTQSPWGARFAGGLSARAGVSRADVYNTALRLLALALESPGILDQPGVRVLLGDLLTGIERSDSKES